VKLSGEPALVLKDGSKARFSLKNIPRVDGVDRIQMYFMAVCSDLNGAELRLPPIEVRASQHVVPPVTFEYTESKHTELKRLPDQFWK